MNIKQTKSLLPSAVGGLSSIGLYSLHFGGFFQVWIHGLAILLGGISGVVLVNRIRFNSGISKTSSQVASPDRGRFEEPEVKALKHTLSKAQYLENIDSKMAENALKQFDQILERRNQFVKSLELRFEKTELTFDRYQSAADEVCTLVLDQLKLVSISLGSLNAMNLKGTKAKLKQNADPVVNPILDAQLKLGNQLESDIKDVLNRNENAITGFDEVIIAVSEIKTSKSGGSTDLDSMMEDLQRLSSRAKKYSI